MTNYFAKIIAHLKSFACKKLADRNHNAVTLVDMVVSQNCSQAAAFLLHFGVVNNITADDIVAEANSRNINLTDFSPIITYINLTLIDLAMTKSNLVIRRNAEKSINLIHEVIRKSKKGALQDPF